MLCPPLRILHLYISPGHNFIGHAGREADSHPSIEKSEIRLLANRGIEEDRYLDYKANYKGQITFFDQAVYLDLCEKLKVKDQSTEVFRRNVITAGFDLNQLIGQEFEIQGIRFLGTEECRPCFWMEKAFAPGAEAALRGHGGLRAKILSDGVLRCGA